MIISEYFPSTSNRNDNALLFSVKCSVKLIAWHARNRGSVSHLGEHEHIMYNIDPSGKILELELTLRCNFTCDYCTNGRNDVLDKRIPECDLDTIKHRIAEFDHIYIYGGEPTLHPNIVDIVKMMKEMGKDYVIQTNLSLAKVIAKILAADASAKFQVSIHRTQPGHIKTIKNIAIFKDNLSQVDIMFVGIDDLKLYRRYKDLVPNLRLVPVADFGTSSRKYLPSLQIYNKLRRILNDVRFDDGIRSYVWESQFLGNISPKGKPCPCIGGYFQMDPAGNMHHCPQRYDGDICPFESCFNIDSYEI